MVDRRMTEEHSILLLRVLLNNPNADDDEVFRALPSRVRRQHDDEDLGKRHVPWRRRGICVLIRLLEWDVGERPLLDDVKAASDIVQWARVPCMVLFFPDLRNKKAVAAGMEEVCGSWDDCGYAPMANAVIDEMQGVTKERLNCIDRALSARLSQRRRSILDRELAKLKLLRS